MPLFPNKEIKKYINSLLCPICQCSLEGTPKLLSDGHTEKINLFCSRDNDCLWGNHRVIDINWDLNANPIEPKIICDYIAFMFNDIRYECRKFSSGRLDVAIYEPNSYGFYEYSKVSHWISSKDLKIDFDPFDPGKIVKTIELFRFYS